MYTYLSLKHLWYTRLFSHMNETHAQLMLFDQTFIAFLGSISSISLNSAEQKCF